MPDPSAAHSSHPSDPAAATRPVEREHDPDCELCLELKLSEWFHADDECWVAECIICSVPMVVWRRHVAAPPDEVKARLHDRLRAVVAEHFLYEPWIDDDMRQIPTHYHAHARPRGSFYGHGLPRRPRPD